MLRKTNQMRFQTKSTRRATKAMALLLAVALVFGQEASLLLAAPPAKVNPGKAARPEQKVQPEDAGPPADAGKPETPGKPDKASDSSGPGPSTKSSSEDNGKPATAGKPAASGKPDEAGNPNGPGPSTQSPSQNSGRPADAGKPATTGKPDDAGVPSDSGPSTQSQSQNSGRPTDAGKPATTGRPAASGKPDDAGVPSGSGPSTQSPSQNNGRPAEAGKPATAGKPDDVGDTNGLRPSAEAIADDRGKLAEVGKPASSGKPDEPGGSSSRGPSTVAATVRAGRPNDEETIDSRRFTRSAANAPTEIPARGPVAWAIDFGIPLEAGSTARGPAIVELPTRSGSSVVSPLELPAMDAFGLGGFDLSFLTENTSSVDEGLARLSMLGDAGPPFGSTTLSSGFLRFAGFDSSLFTPNDVATEPVALGDEEFASVAEVVAQSAGFLPFVFGGFDPSLW